MRKIFAMLALLFSVHAIADVLILRPGDASLTKYALRVNSARQTLESLEKSLSAKAGGQVFQNFIFRQCGEKNAFFDRGTKNIVMCYEYMGFLEKKVGAGDRWTNLEFFAMVHVLLHEFGHAVSASRGWGVLSKEEDSADAIAAMMVKKAPENIKKEFLQAILLAKRGSLFVDAKNILLYDALNDVHSLEMKRRANAICWAGGNDWALLERSVSMGYITKARASGCNRESADMERAFEHLIGSPVIRNPWE